MFVIDVQGFNYGNDQHMWREIAIFNTNTETYKHKLVRMPHKLELFNQTTQNHMNWLCNNLHGLEWNTYHYDDYDLISYEELTDFIKEEVQNDGVILVKGIDKKVWLEKFLSNQIIDLEENRCPSFKKLKEIFKSYHCNRHYHNNLNCALENVYYLFYWYTYCNKINDLLTYLICFYCFPVDPNPPSPLSVTVTIC